MHDDDEDDEVNVSVRSRGQEGGMLAGGSVPEDYSKFSWKGISGGDANVGLEENCVESNRSVLGSAGPNASASEYVQRGVDRGRKRKTAFDSYSGPAISDGTFRADPLCSCSCFPSVWSCFHLFSPSLCLFPYCLLYCAFSSVLCLSSLLSSAFCLAAPVRLFPLKMGVTGLRTVESGRAHVPAMDHLGNKELGEFWRGNAPSGQTVGQELMDFAFSKRSY